MPYEKIDACTMDIESLITNNLNCHVIVWEGKLKCRFFTTLASYWHVKQFLWQYGFALRRTPQQMQHRLHTCSVWIDSAYNNTFPCLALCSISLLIRRLFVIKSVIYRKHEPIGLQLTLKVRFLGFRGRIHIPQSMFTSVWWDTSAVV